MKLLFPSIQIPLSIVFLTLLVACKPLDKIQETSVKPSATPAVNLVQNAIVTTAPKIASNPIAPNAPTWRDLTPGKSSRGQVIQLLGRPTVTQTNQDLETLSYYPYGLDSFRFIGDNYRVVLRDDVVQLILVKASDETSLATLKQELGDPETIIEAVDTHYGDVYVFATHGIAVEAADETAEGLYTVEYFAPMTVQDYLASWGRYHPRDNPVAVNFPGHPIDIGVVPGSSTRQDILSLYGEPDYQAPFANWGYPPKQDPTQTHLILYAYRVPLSANWKSLGDASVGFIVDEQGIVDLVYVQGPPPVTLANLIAKYREPQWIYQRDATPVPSAFSDIATCYFLPEEGISFVAIGEPLGSPEDTVRFEWFYPPTTWDDYWSSWGAGPCRGFQSQAFKGELREWKGFQKP